MAVNGAAALDAPTAFTALLLLSILREVTTWPRIASCLPLSSFMSASFQTAVARIPEIAGLFARHLVSMRRQERLSLAAQCMSAGWHTFYAVLKCNQCVCAMTSPPQSSMDGRPPRRSLASSTLPWPALKTGAGSAHAESAASARCAGGQRQFHRYLCRARFLRLGRRRSIRRRCCCPHR